jgi:spoIIIJ-associated protein
MDNTCQQAGNFLQSAFESSGLGLRVSVAESEDQCLLNLEGPDADLLIAEGGQLLDAMQYLVNQVFSRSLPQGQRLTCDVRSFRATREAELRAMAQHAADQVRSTGSAFTFGAMSGNERRIIHLALAEAEDIFTESIGDGSDRKLRIALK